MDPNQGRPKTDPSPQLQGQCTKWDRDAEVCCGSRMGFQTVLFPRSHCACRAMTARRRRSPSRRPATQSRLAPPAPLACFPMCYLRKASAGGGSAAENPIQDVMTTKRPKKKSHTKLMVLAQETLKQTKPVTLLSRFPRTVLIARDKLNYQNSSTLKM